MLAVSSAESDYWTDWAKNSSADISTYFSYERLHGYAPGVQSVTTPSETDGSFQVTYRKEGVDYTFNVDGNRNVTLATSETGTSTGGTGTGSSTSGTGDTTGGSSTGSETGGSGSESGSGSGSTVVAGGTATGGNKTYSDGTDTATIPEGWTVSGVTGETTISTGLVIYDIPSNVDTTAEGFWTATNSTTGNLLVHENYNQFVWVPVSLASTAENMPRYEGYYNGSKQTYVSNSEVSEPATSGGYSTEASEYTAMINSVKANGGFYVGRYEASSNSGIAESKKGKTPWGSIAWGSSMSSPGTAGAVAKAKAMYEGTSTTAKSSVTSTLIYGCQWDAIMNWIDPNFSTGNCVTSGENKSVLVDSTGKGYYNQSSKTSTGSSTNYAMKNIYDMAGNVVEWTMEACSTSYRVYRGGNYGRTGSTYPVSYRTYVYSPSNTGDYMGFRVTLYCNAES